MVFLKLAVIVGILFELARTIQALDRHCQRRFGHRFFTMRGFWLAATGLNFLWWGYYAWVAAPLRQTSASGGLALMAMGLAAVAWLIHENVRESDLLYGLGGSILQFVLFFPVALYGIPLLVIALIFLLFATYRGTPAWLIDP